MRFSTARGIHALGSAEETDNLRMQATAGGLRSTLIDSETLPAAPDPERSAGWLRKEGAGFAVY